MRPLGTPSERDRDGDCSFPFDRQNCSITFGSWNYEARFVRFESAGEPDLSAYYDNQEWVLLDAAARAALLRTQMAGDFSTLRLHIHVCVFVCSCLLPRFLPLLNLVHELAPSEGSPLSLTAT